MSIIAPRVHPVRATSPPDESWHESMRTAVRDPSRLCDMVGLDASWREAAIAASHSFPVFAPLGYISRIEAGNPHDPLLRQVLPLDKELQTVQGFTVDPVGDAAARRSPGLLQKYRGRALMIMSGTCAVHCRYCFRRHYPYQDNIQSPRAWADAIEQIADDRTIEEVILSGGDPLTQADSRLARLTGNLAEIPHLRRLRLHTRLPIMIPERVTDGLLEWLTGTRLTTVVVVHANHPNELDESVADSLIRLASLGLPVLNQAVLLRGVNDSADALIELSRRLVECRVMPYYLHQLDRVAGAAHFEVAIDAGRQLIQQMRRQLPGYAVPRYVQELPGAISKQPLA